MPILFAHGVSVHAAPDFSALAWMPWLVPVALAGLVFIGLATWIWE